MKKQNILLFVSLLLSLLFMVSCKKNVIGGFDGTTVVAEPKVPVVNKKGVAFSKNSKAWSHKTSELGAHWMYSWGNVLREEIPENVEFVPMFWGAGSVNQDNLDRIKGLIDDGTVKFVLGFNEPDGVTQANMTVDKAIELWPQLEALGVPLISPATVNPNNDWMKEFMRRADELNLRVDYVGVHHYGGANVLSFVNKLKDTYEAYGREIWITEFAVADWNATSPDNNVHSEASIISFMNSALATLDDIDWIYRYAWFDGRQAPLFTSALYDAEANITSVGQVYAGNNPNFDIGPGVDTEFVVTVDPDELLINGGFEAGVVVPWGGFKNGVATDALTGNFAGKIENGDGSLLYVVDVTPETNYILKFSSKWSEVISNTFSAKIRNNSDNTLIFSLPDMPMSADWEETTYEFTVPAGVEQLKIVFYKANGFPPFFLDDVSFKLE